MYNNKKITYIFRLIFNCKCYDIEFSANELILITQEVLLATLHQNTDTMNIPSCQEKEQIKENIKNDLITALLKIRLSSLSNLIKPVNCSISCIRWDHFHSLEVFSFIKNSATFLLFVIKPFILI